MNLGIEDISNRRRRANQFSWRERSYSDVRDQVVDRKFSTFPYTRGIGKEIDSFCNP
jgi:hypothetical protein